MKLQTARWSRSSDPVLHINSCFGGLFRSRWKTVADWQMMGLCTTIPAAAFQAYLGFEAPEDDL